MRPKKIFAFAFTSIVAGLAIYYFFPFQKIQEGTIIDKIVVFKSKHKLLAYSSGRLIVIYRIAIGKNQNGDKEYEGDMKTPEGFYTISDKNPNSEFHKNLGISYPNGEDITQARQLSKPVGGDIKIHGLKAGLGFIGRFHRWRDWTNGCIAITNEEIDELYKHTPVGIPIEILK